MTDTITDKGIWFITGAGRGMGLDFAKSALADGHAVVATGRDIDAVAKAVGDSDDLLVVKLDVTSRTDALAAAQAAVESDAPSDAPPQVPLSRREADLAKKMTPAQRARFSALRASRRPTPSRSSK